MKKIRLEYNSYTMRGHCEIAKPKTIEGYKAMLKTVRLLLDRGHTVTLSKV